MSRSTEQASQAVGLVAKDIRARMSPEAQRKEFLKQNGIVVEGNLGQEDVGQIQAPAQPTPETPEEVKAEGEESSDVLQTIRNLSPTAVLDVNTPAGRLVGQGGASIVDSLQEIGNFGIDTANSFENWLAEKGIGSGDLIAEDAKLDFADDILTPKNTQEQVVRSVAKYLIPYGATLKLAKGAPAARALKATGVTAAFDFAAIDPKEEKLSNLIQENPILANPLSEFLAAKEDDTNAEGRFKNALEGIVIDNALAGTFLLAAKGIRKFRNTRAVPKRGDIEIEGDVVKQDGVELDASKLDRNPEDIIRIDPKKEKLKGTRVNIDKLDGEDPIKLVTRFVNENPDVIKEARRGSIKQQVTIARGTQILRDSEKLEDLLSFEPGQALNAEELAASRLLVNGMGDDLIESTARAIDGDAFDEAIFLRKLETFKRVNEVFFGGAAEAGRSLNILKTKITSASKEVRVKAAIEAVNLHGGSGNVKKMAKYLQDIANVPDSDFVQIGQRITTKSAGRTALDSLWEIRINGLVSSPRTLAVGALSPLFVTGPVRIVERGLAELFSTGAKGDVAKGESRILINTFLDESVKTITAGYAGFLDGIKLAKEEFLKSGLGATTKKGLKNFIQSGKKQKNFRFKTFVEQRDLNPAITSEAYGYKGVAAGGIDMLGAVTRIPTRALASADQVIASLHFKMERNALIHREIVGRGVDPSSKEGRQLWNELVKDPIDEANIPSFIDEPKKLRQKRIDISEQAEQFANENKFTNELEGIFGTMDRLVKETGRKSLGVAPLRIIAPFSRIDMAMTQFGLERAPIISFKLLQEDIRAGGSRAALAKAKISFGHMIFATGGMLAYNGLITGEGPQNPDARKLLKQAGRQDNSIRIGDDWVRHDKLADPFSRYLSVAADMAEISAVMQEEERTPELLGLAGLASAALLQSMTPEFITRNMGDVKDILEARGTEQKIQRLINGIAVGQVPFSSLLRDFRKQGVPGAEALGEAFGLESLKEAGIGDDVIRDTRVAKDDPLRVVKELINEVKNTLPGFSQNLPPRRNLFGEVMHYPPGFGPDIVSPLTSMKIKDDPVFNELLELGMASPLAKPDPLPGEQHLLVRMPKRTIQMSVGDSSLGLKATIRLDAVQYDRLVQLSAGIGLKPDFNPLGTRATLKEALAKEISRNYPSLPGRKTKEGKKIIIKTIISGYQRGASLQMRQERDIKEKIESQLRLREFKILRGEPEGE